MNKIDVIAAGHLCLDMIPRFETAGRKEIGDLLRPGTLVNMGEMTFATGGAVSNVGRAMKRFGATVAFMAKVGDDPVGATIMDILKGSGNLDGISVAPGAVSSYTVVVAPPNIDRIFLHCPGANDTFTVQDINMSIVERARLFHLGYPTLMGSLFADDGAELAAILKMVKGTGISSSLDISLPDPDSPAGRADWRTILGAALPWVDIFVPSIEEAFFSLHPQMYLQQKEDHGGEELIDHISPQEYSDLADEYLQLGCAVCVLKAGHRGWYLKTAGADRMERMGRAAPTDISNWANRELWCPAFEAKEIASTNGAGDSSIAGFYTALLGGHDLESCVRLANCAGYLNLRQMDTLSGLPSWEELVKTAPMLNPRSNDFLKNAGWQQNEEKQLWEKK